VIEVSEVLPHDDTIASGYSSRFLSGSHCGNGGSPSRRSTN
jgi:hypothetical protein